MMEGNSRLLRHFEIFVRDNRQARKARSRKDGGKTSASRGLSHCHNKEETANRADRLLLAEESKALVSTTPLGRTDLTDPRRGNQSQGANLCCIRSESISGATPSLR